MNLPCVKGAVNRYCFDVKTFNLTACFIMKCDVKCYDYTLKMAGYEQQCTALVTLLLAYIVSIDWREEFFMR